MIIGDDDLAATVVAALTAALIQTRGTSDPLEAAQLFGAVARALRDEGALSTSVAMRRALSR